MADNQIPVPDLNRIIDELMSELCQGVEEVHLEPQSETMTNAEPENQPKMKEPVEEEDKDFVFAEAKDLWTKVLAYKGFVSERGFRKLISHFS